MEVVNRSEWVSLREFPGKSAKRHAKVSLASIVSNCYWFSDEWYYAEYGGCILSEYLKPSNGRIAFDAMLVTITDGGAPFYVTAVVCGDIPM